jgi:tRNA uridine 5-carboxymethylaminomethyl modification enzyme
MFSRVFKRFLNYDADIANKLTTSPYHPVIVVGGGHAGIEAATGSARTGVQTTLITPEWKNIGTTSCNPAFGRHRKRYIIKRN